MTISSAIEQAARIVWRHKILAALGILDIFLTGRGLVDRALSDLLAQFLFFIPGLSGPLAPLAASMPAPLIGLGQLADLYRWLAPYGVAGWAGLIGGVVLVLIALAVLGLVIEGGLIHAVADSLDGRPITLGGIFASGWRRILPMVVIASVPAIPLTLGAALVVAIATLIAQNAGGLPALNADPALMQHILGTLALLAAAILVPLALLTLPLALLSVVAYRPCMLEGLNAVASFRRAGVVTRRNVGPVMILIAVSYAVSLLAGTISSVPGFLASLCLPAVVLIWLIDGLARALYLSLWTVGWRMMLGEGGAAGNQTGHEIVSG